MLEVPVPKIGNLRRSSGQIDVLRFSNTAPFYMASSDQRAFLDHAGPGGG